MAAVEERHGQPPDPMSPADLGIDRLFWAVRDAVVVADAESGRVVLWNPAAERLFGYPAAEAVGRPLAEFLPGSFAVHQPTAASIRPDSLEATRRDSTPIAVEASVSPIADVPGGPYLLAIVRDVTQHRRAEAALARERDLLQSVIDTLPDAVYVKDTASRFVRVNQTTAEVLGLTTPEDAVGKSDFDFFPASLARQYFADEQRVVESGEPVLNKLEPQSEDAEAGPWWLTSTVPLRDGEGRVTGLLGIGRDVTEHTRAEAERLKRERAEAARAAAEAAQARLAFLAEATALLGASLDHGANLDRVARLAVPDLADWCAVVVEEYGGPQLIASELARRLAPQATGAGGADPSTLLARTMATGVAEILPDLAGSAMEEPEAVAHAWPLLRRGLHSAVAVPLAIRGRTLGAMGFGRGGDRPAFDAADLALAEELARRAALAIEHARIYEEAKASEARFRTLVDSTVAGVVLADADGNLHYANDAYLRIVGYDRADFDAGRVRWTELTPPEWVEADRRAIAEVRAGGVSAPYEKEYIRKDGERVPILVAVARIEEAGREQLIGTVLDIGERKRLERLRQDFLAMVTHDLRTPLTTVRAGVQLLQRRGEYRESTVASVLAQAERMQRLLDDLADVVRLEEGRIELRRGEVDLVEVAHGVVTALAAHVGRQRLRVAVPAGPVTGSWDGDRLTQVLENLVANAIKYSAEDRPIVVEVGSDPTSGDAHLTVRDEGPGISVERQANLFERFYRADATGAGGLGLGLYIARMIVEAHGGRITVASEPGKGSAFTVTLPRSA